MEKESLPTLKTVLMEIEQFSETENSIYVSGEVPELISNDLRYLTKGNSNVIVSGIRKEWVELMIRFTIAKIVFKHYKNPVKCIQILNQLDKTRRKILGESRIKKISKTDGTYSWDLYIPAWPSRAFNKLFEAEINRISPIEKKTNRFSNIFLAVTKKCILQCEHCFEWDALNGKEKLSLQDLKSIVQKFQELGTSQFQLTGGEPLLRVNDLVELIECAGKETEFWILTSGYNLTIENAQKLKKAGLKGVVVSLDHFDPKLHNLFRGTIKSYQWVEEAIKNAIAANLITALSICVTKAFVTESNLMQYARLAKNLGVSFVQILEPKPVGHYKGKDVHLSAEQEAIIETFFWKMNFDSSYKKYPIVNYHGYYQRRVGCFASGNRNLYIDTDGDMHACPFCQSKMGSALSGNLNTIIDQLQIRGCHSFKNVNL